MVGQDDNPSCPEQELQEKLSHLLATIGSLDATLSVRRHGVTQLLDTSSVYLENEDFSASFMRRTFSSLLTYIGRGDGQWRHFLLEGLRATRNSRARQVLLEFLPSSIPLARSEDNGNTLEKSMRQVMETLRIVLPKDPSALVPTLECL